MKQLLFLLMIVPFTTPLLLIAKNPASSTIPVSKTPCLMIIFVHGTIKPAKFSFSVISTILSNKIQNSLYEKMIHNLRNTNYLYQCQPIQELGLVPIDSFHPESRIGAHCIKNLFEEQYTFYDIKPGKRLYYTFGWSGLLSSTDRLTAAKDFYAALEKEVTQLQIQGYNPKIQINAFSHGGSVALNLATVKNTHHYKPAFTIDQLILLGTPIQKNTDALAADTYFFKKIYSLYSEEDYVQRYDCFSTSKGLCSRNTFGKKARRTLPKNITQIRIRLTKKIRRLPAHIDLEQDDLFTALNIRGLQHIHADSGHSEFWNLAWGTAWYRKNFPLNPLPIAAFVPTIIHLINEYVPNESSLIFDYCPSFNGARIIVPTTKKAIAIPVLSKELVTHMKERGTLCMPEGYCEQERNRQVVAALEKAREELKQEKKLKKSEQKKLTSSYTFLSRKIRAHFLPNF